MSPGRPPLSPADITWLCAVLNAGNERLFTDIKKPSAAVHAAAEGQTPNL